MAEYKDGNYIVKDGKIYEVQIDIPRMMGAEVVHVALKDFKKQTNADRIRAMTDEELAEKLTWIVPYCGDCPARIGNGEECAKDCKKAWLAWLRKDADE